MKRYVIFSQDPSPKQKYRFKREPGTALITKNTQFMPVRLLCLRVAGEKTQSAPDKTEGQARTKCVFRL